MNKRDSKNLILFRASHNQFGSKFFCKIIQDMVELILSPQISMTSYFESIIFSRFYFILPLVLFQNDENLYIIIILLIIMIFRIKNSMARINDNNNNEP